MAVPTFQAAGTLQQTTTTITVAWPAHAAGDIGFLLIETANEAPTLTTASGFDLVLQTGFGTAAGTNATMLSLYWCRATSASMASVVTNDPGDHITGVIITFRGCVDSGVPWAGFTVGTKTTSSTSASWPSTGVTQPGGRVVLLTACGQDSNTATYSVPTNSNLTGITEHLDTGNLNGGGGHVQAASGTYVGTSGSTGTSAATITDTFTGDLIEVNVTMVLKNRPPHQFTRLHEPQPVMRSAIR